MTRYLCLAILLAGCAATPKLEGSGTAANGAAPTVSELTEMMRVGTARLERDTVLNGWLIRDSSGVVIVTGISVGEDGGELPAGYGDCLVK